MKKRLLLLLAFATLVSSSLGLGHASTVHASNVGTRDCTHQWLSGPQTYVFDGAKYGIASTDYQCWWDGGQTGSIYRIESDTALWGSAPFVYYSCGGLWANGVWAGKGCIGGTAQAYAGQNGTTYWAANTYFYSTLVFGTGFATSNQSGGQVTIMQFTPQTGPQLFPHAENWLDR